MRSLSTGIVGDGSAKGGTATDAGTVITTGKINVFALQTKKISAVAGNPLHARPGILEWQLRQLWKTFIEAYQRYSEAYVSQTTSILSLGKFRFKF